MTLIKTLRYILLAGIFGSLFIPFLYGADLFFPFITTKAYAFRVLVEILFAVWLILALFDPTARPKKSLILWSFVGFLGVIFIANLQGIDFVKSFWSNFERMEGYITLLHLFAYFLVASATLYKEELWYKFWNFSIGLTVVHAGWAILQKSGAIDVGLSADRIDGTFGNAIYLGLFMLFHVFITLFYLLKHKDQNWVKYFYLIAIALQMITIFLAATRGAILAVFGGVVLTFILISILEPKRKAIRKITAGLILGTILFTAFIFGFKDSSVVQNVVAFRRLSEMSFDSGTVLARFINWGIAWEGVKEKPLLGYGQGNYGPTFDKNYDPRMWDQEQWFDRVHNIFFDWLIAGGILGLLSYLSLFFGLLYYIWKKENNKFDNIEKSVLTSLLVAYLFHNIFVFDNLTSYMMFVLVLAFVNSRVFVKNYEKEKFNLPKNVSISIAVVILVLLPVTVWAVNADSYRQNREMIEGLRVRNISELPMSLEHFKKSLSYNSFGNVEVRQQLLNQTSRVLRSENIPVEVKQDFANFSAEEIQKEIEDHPDNARFLITSAQLLAQIGNFNNALGFFAHARELSPNKQFITEPIIEILFAMGKKEEALQLAFDAYSINTESDNAWRAYVRSLIKAGETGRYEEVLNEAFETGNSYRVIDLVQENLRNDPENIQARASLAVAYYRSGDKERAIVELKNLGEKFPEAKGQVDSLIKKIEAGESII